jgi:gluconate kinase
MPAALLQSQIDTLEEPSPDEDALTVEIDRPPQDVAQDVIRLLAGSVPVAAGTASDRR